MTFTWRDRHQWYSSSLLLSTRDGRPSLDVMPGHAMGINAATRAGHWNQSLLRLSIIHLAHWSNWPLAKTSAASSPVTSAGNLLCIDRLVSAGSGRSNCFLHAIYDAILDFSPATRHWGDYGLKNISKMGATTCPE